MGILKSIFASIVYGKETSRLIYKNENQFNKVVSDSNALVIKYVGIESQKLASFKEILKLADNEIFSRFRYQSEFLSPPEAAMLKLAYLFQFGEEANISIIIKQSTKAITRIREDFEEKIGASISVEIYGKTGS